MRRFLLTIPAKFKGAVEAQYNTDGKLWKIDFSKVELTPEVLSWFKKGIPVLVENMKQYEEITGVKVEEAEFEVTFEDFMREYPYKRNTHLARSIWPNLAGPVKYQAFLAAIEYRKCLERSTWGQKPMIADKWLKTQQYLNDWKEL